MYSKGVLVFMNTRHAQMILTILRHGSFTAAAKALYITQPTLSQTVKQIETQLGEPIFVRGRTPLTLTPAGEMYAQAARQIVRIETQLNEAISHMQGKTYGTLRLGFPLHRSSEVLPQILSDFLRQYPDVRIDICEGNDAQLAALLNQRELDIAFMESEQRMDTLEYRLVASEEIILLAGKQAQLAQRVPSGSTISLSQAAQERFVLATDAIQSYFDQQIQHLHITPASVLRCDNAQTAMRVCANSALVTLCPYITLLSSHSAMQQLAHYHLSGEAFLPPLTAATLCGETLAPYAEALLSLYSMRYRAMTAYRP